MHIESNLAICMMQNTYIGSFIFFAAAYVNNTNIKCTKVENNFNSIMTIETYFKKKNCLASR